MFIVYMDIHYIVDKTNAKFNIEADVFFILVVMMEYAKKNNGRTLDEEKNCCRLAVPFCYFAIDFISINIHIQIYAQDNILVFMFNYVKIQCKLNKQCNSSPIHCNVQGCVLLEFQQQKKIIARN